MLCLSNLYRRIVLGMGKHTSMVLTLYKGHPVDPYSNRLLRFTSNIQNVKLLFRSIPLSAIYQVGCSLIYVCM
jgi:hypothetical protein